jgi:hypothetical protein
MLVDDVEEDLVRHLWGASGRFAHLYYHTSGPCVFCRALSRTFPDHSPSEGRLIAGVNFLAELLPKLRRSIL